MKIKCFSWICKEIIFSDEGSSGHSSRSATTLGAWTLSVQSLNGGCCDNLSKNSLNPQFVISRQTEEAVSGYNKCDNNQNWKFKTKLQIYLLRLRSADTRTEQLRCYTDLHKNNLSAVLNLFKIDVHLHRIFSIRQMFEFRPYETGIPA